MTVVHPKELGTPEIERWRELQLADDRCINAFLSPEFAIAIGRCRESARVGIVEDDGIAGFFPFEIGALHTGRAIGLGVSDLQGMIHQPGLVWDARQLLRRCRINTWDFDHLIAEQQHFQPFIRERYASAVMDLSNGYDAYMDEGGRRSRRLVKSAMQKQRKLIREHGHLRVEFDSPCDATLNLLMDWKSAQYRRTGRSDRFARPWVRALVDDLRFTKSETLSGLLSILYVEDRPLAVHFGVACRDYMSLWFPAYDTDFAKYSPGLLLFFEMAKLAKENGVAQMDLGRGDEDYKHSLKSFDYYVADGMVAQRSMVGLARRAQKVPRRSIENLVLGSPALRKGARRTLRSIGRVRETKAAILPSRQARK